MNKFSRKIAIFYLLSMLFVLAITNVNFVDIFSLPQNFCASYTDVDNVNKNALFGTFVKASLEKSQTGVSSQKDNDGTIVFKLFGFIPIRKVKVNILPEEEVYIGGVPIGLSLTTDGAVVVSESIVNTADGQVSTNKFFKCGDILKSIDGQQIETLEDIENLLNQSDGDVKIEYIRKNRLESADINLLKTEGGYKLGLWVKDDVSGIGTLTYVDKENHNFAALGHPITDGKEGNIITLSDGKVYTCSLVGISKGEKNNPGELRCVFMQSNAKGNLVQNNKYGIYGHLDDTEGLVDANRTALLGGRLSVRPGKAKIISSISGIREEYDIEIIKASFQSKSDDKSIVFRVTDKRLLQLTGGIVQGMSGSPIMQNGKIVGAVTHVFLTDPTKGYGVYTDWMRLSEQN